jgi:hypothetical protein
MEDRSKSSILLKNLQISTDQEKLLAELAETIIPKTSSPGAKDLSAHLFALKMIDDCRSKEDQDRFIEGLKAFEKMAGKDFARQSMQERAKILEPLEKDKDAKEPAAAFYRTMKRLTIQAYTSSEYFLTKVQVYEMVPGRYHGCVPVKAS